MAQVILPQQNPMACGTWNLLYFKSAVLPHPFLNKRKAMFHEDVAAVLRLRPSFIKNYCMFPNLSHEIILMAKVSVMFSLAILLIRGVDNLFAERELSNTNTSLIHPT
jgi:hypothetical protein